MIPSDEYIHEEFEKDAEETAAAAYKFILQVLHYS